MSRRFQTYQHTSVFNFGATFATAGVSRQSYWLSLDRNSLRTSDRTLRSWSEYYTQQSLRLFVLSVHARSMHQHSQQIMYMFPDGHVFESHMKWNE
jgi:hypothetical protein